MRALLSLALLCSGVGAADWSETRARFKRAYVKDADLATRREAILEMGRADVPPAAQLLFRLWDGLARDTAKLSTDLHKVRGKLRAPGAQASADEKKALDEAATSLDRRLARAEAEQGAVLEAISLLKGEATLDWLAETGLVRAKAPLLLRTVAATLAGARRTGVQALLVALDRVRKAEQIVPLLHSLGERGPALAPGLPAVLKHLDHRDWAVRIAAAHALARSAQPDAVGPLVEALKLEKNRSRAQREIARALAILTGANLGPFPDLWTRWWNDHKASVVAGSHELGRGKPGDRSDQGRFYGIPQAADRIVYLFDRSGSMDVSMEHPQWVDGKAVPARDNEESRFDATRRELLRATRNLRRGTLFAVVLFSSHVDPLHDGLIAAGEESHRRLSDRMAREGPGGSTNIYEALDFALRMANVHPDLAAGAPKADAIILLSDGSPTDSKGRTEDPERTLQAVRGWNALGRITIHTIGVGRQHNAGFLGALARENGGNYYAVLPRKGKGKKGN